MNFKVEAGQNFNETIGKLKEVIAANNFRILHIHNVKNTLGEKGFEIEDYSIVEVCNAKFANEVLKMDKEFGTMMPCKIILYSEKGKVYLLLPLPTEIAKSFGMDSVYSFAEEVEKILKKIVSETINK